MMVDVRSRLMWYPDHLTERFASEALRSKLVTADVERTGPPGVLQPPLPYHSHPEDQWRAAASADRVIVFGLHAKATGIWVMKELVADYVAQHKACGLGVRRSG